MTFQLKEVVPWGRSFDEYTAMFDLKEDDLGKRILGCADGPASFNAELTEKGGTVVSVDPLYGFSSEMIRQRIDETYEEVLAQTRNNMDGFVWTSIPSVETLGEIRMAAMTRFIDDFEQGGKDGRYIPGSLPDLCFPNNKFDLAICSHFLFLYSGQLDKGFHLHAISEMCRVAREIRIFPLLQLGSKPSPHVPGVISYFSESGFSVDIVKVNYEFQKGGNEMLRIRK
jgi:SAM-dependent methyltransferase